nr:RNA-directed DNA polymerase, eukaryota [Tanacetum cinerariifolium]
EAFHDHFEARFKKPITNRLKLNFPFNKRLLHDQATDLERRVSRDEIRMAVWNCGEIKSPGPDGFTFEFFSRYWDFVGPDFCEAVEHFFVNGSFSKGCNSFFVALIPKVMDAKFVNDYRPISLIGSVYKVVTKILANRLAVVIADIVSDTQSAFIVERQILDGPFIINEVLHWCKRKNKKAMFFKVDFAKAYDSVRWDYLIDVLEAFGFCPTWCKWIRGTFCFAKASVLVNGSPSNEFQFHRGLKQGDPLSPYLFILVMESLPLSFSRAVEEGLFKGICLNGSVSISHLFYADDAMFIGEWSDANLRGIINILKCFFLASGLQININKSQVLGVGVPRLIVEPAASSFGCTILKNQFRYLGVMVGECMSRNKEWADVVLKLRLRLSKWKVKTLSIGDGSLWFRVVQALYGSMIVNHSAHMASNWCSIPRELHLLKEKGFDFLSHCHKRIGDGNNTRFWSDIWKGDRPLKEVFLHVFALELDKEILVAESVATSVDHSFRRPIRGGVEQQQRTDLALLMDSVSLSSSQDRWPEPTRWVKYIPIKVNVFAWRARRDCLPTRVQLIRRGVTLESTNCPLCRSCEEDIHHVLFRCDVARTVLCCVCRWWDLDWQAWSSFSD